MKFSRRQYFKTTGLAASSLLVSTSYVNSDNWFSNIFKFNSKNNKDEVVGIPVEWIKIGGTVVYEYANYILGLNLKNITPRMVIAPHFKRRGRTRNCLPPKSIWRKIEPTLDIVDELANVVGTPLDEIVSVYRSPEYNRAVRGKSRSYHMQNQAIDISFKGTSSWRVAKAAKRLRDREKKFKGGVGTYSSFVHIDTRGKNTNW